MRRFLGQQDNLVPFAVRFSQVCIRNRNLHSVRISTGEPGLGSSAAAPLTRCSVPRCAALLLLLSCRPSRLWDSNLPTQTRGVSRAFPPPVCIHVVEEDNFPLKQLRRRPSLQRGMQTWLLELCLEAQQPGGQQGELLGAVPISDAKHSETLGVAMKNGAWPLLPGRCSLTFKLFSSRCTPLGNPLFPSVQGEASESTGKEGKALQERSASTASARELMC